MLGRFFLFLMYFAVFSAVFRFTKRILQVQLKTAMFRFCLFTANVMSLFPVR